jgi:uncharacterized coiled-coil protein SlyX
MDFFNKGLEKTSKLSENDANELFNRLRFLEMKGAEQDKDISSIITAVREVKEIFKEHDDKEMKKYEQTDNSIKQMTESMIKVNENLNSLDSSIKNQSTQLEKLSEAHYKHKEDVDNRLDKQDAKINKMLGGLILGSILLGMSWQVYTYFANKFERQEHVRIEEKKQLEEKIKLLENYTNRNKGSLDTLKQIKGK